MPILNGRLYDILKFVCMLVLPAFATFYLTIGQLWGLPATEKVVGTIVAFDTFLGAVLQISSAKFNNSDRAVDGFLDANGADPDTGMPQLKMTITSPPADLLKQKHVRLRVGSPAAEPDHG